MKKVLLAILLSVITFSSVNAQKIEMKKVFGGYTFSQNDKTITLNQMQEIVKDNQEAFDLVKSAKSNQTWGMVLGGIGGGLIGYPIGTAIGGGDPEWALAGVGVAFIVATIPIVKGFNRKTKKAVELYNADQPTASSNFQPQFNLNLKGMSMGISMTF
ncbi:hypothetical protein H9W90_14965 [Polaribacter pectinis]|uniref:DUF4199 domain-containing protein n=1 Tax=Polaribacter pectinis TaxID=2738844 RepID=A0A7G9LA18_9FLAO|nr:hypothetical protein [Polaribacter pectinis]QNM85467.1 hypothetical protein H9W90_14965 [Polaribacter pectinis]